MSSNKLNIKSEMKAIDCKEKDWYDSLTDEEKSQISLWQLMRFTSSCNSKIQDINNHYLIMTNELVNVNFNKLKKEKELQFKLLQIVGLGTKQFHPWIHPPKKEKKDLLHEWLVEKFPELNDDEINLIKSNDKNTIINYMKEHGIDDKTIKEIMK